MRQGLRVNTPDLDFQTHERYMRMAIQQARNAIDLGEVPTGCVILNHPSTSSLLRQGSGGHAGQVESQPIIGRSHNQTELLKDPTAHAEMLAITQAANALGDWRLTQTVLYVTKEPCVMCAGAIVLARIPTVIIGTPDKQRGAISVFNVLDSPHLNHRCQVTMGILEDECRALLQEFFKSRRLN